MRLFSKDPGVIAYGQTAMKYFCPFYWILAILHSLAGAVLMILYAWKENWIKSLT